METAQEWKNIDAPGGGFGRLEIMLKRRGKNMNKGLLGRSEAKGQGENSRKNPLKRGWRTGVVP
jgi:hypothetical protein